jgi:hypothetical protein
MNTNKQWTFGKPTSETPLVATANRKAGFLAAVRGFEFTSNSHAFGTYLPALQFVWAAPSPGCVIGISQPKVTNVPYMQKVASLKQTCPNNLLINGGFEFPKLDDVLAGPDPESLPGFGWSVKNCPQMQALYGGSATELQREDHPFTILPFWNPEGANRFELAPDSPQSICQVVQTKPGAKYELCFLHRKRTDTGPRQNTVTTVRAGESGGKLQELLKIRCAAITVKCVSAHLYTHSVTFGVRHQLLQHRICYLLVGGWRRCYTMYFTRAFASMIACKVPRHASIYCFQGQRLLQKLGNGLISVLKHCRTQNPTRTHNDTTTTSQVNHLLVDAAGRGQKHSNVAQGILLGDYFATLHQPDALCTSFPLQRKPAAMIRRVTKRKLHAAWGPIGSVLLLDQYLVYR